ncbi:MAG: DNA repair exonuclease [Desulfobaccales bacterium]|nr:DNA repair exonuclease [Desulfobaccales bacterium]
MSETVSFTFVHCADLHLDSPFEGLQVVDSRMAATLRDATFKAFDQVIDLAIRERADFLLVAGDVYDGADRSLRAQLKFRDGLRRAVEAGVQCYVAYGNHDPLSGWEAKLEMPPGVHIFGGEEVEQFTVRREGVTLAQVYGISYPVREVRENLVPRFKRQGKGPFAIGILHGNVGGNPNHDNYAPCKVENLVASNMDYWALGHIHAQQIMREHDPCIIYPGNTQGRSVRELGARGCYLVRVDDIGRLTPRFVATDVVRWFLQEVDIADMTTWDDLLNLLSLTKEEVRAAAQGRAAILRLHLTGRGELHAQLRRVDPERDLALPLRESETERPDFVWVESLQNRTRPLIDIAKRRREPDFLGDFLSAAENLRTAENPGATLKEVLSGRPEHRLIAPQIDQLTDADLLTFLTDAETLGLDLLLEE